MHIHTSPLKDFEPHSAKVTSITKQICYLTIKWHIQVDLKRPYFKLSLIIDEIKEALPHLVEELELLKLSNSEIKEDAARLKEEAQCLIDNDADNRIVELKSYHEKLKSRISVRKAIVTGILKNLHLEFNLELIDAENDQIYFETLKNKLSNLKDENIIMNFKRIYVAVIHRLNEK